MDNLIAQFFKKTGSLLSWLVPGGLYYQFKKIDAAPLIEQLQKQHPTNDFNSLEKTVSKFKTYGGYFTEITRGVHTVLAPLLMYFVTEMTRSSTPWVYDGPEQYARMCIVGYVSGTVLGFFCRAVLKRRVLNDLITEARINAYETIDAKVDTQIKIPQSADEWRQLEKDIDKYYTDNF